MNRSVRYCVAFAWLALSSGCASERAPINRVQPEALQKSFFVGASLTEDGDDPQFYYRPTVADVDYGASQSGLFTASYAQTTARVRWEITEDKLLARLAYERIEGSTGNGIEETNTGQIAAAFRIEKHFDVRRDYNPQTGEELNVVVENSTDRPWYEREFMRVDWSQNLISSAYDLDTLAALKIFADEPLVYEPVAYSVKDPSDPDAPVFEASSGYFDITNKVYVTPQILNTPFGTFPACFFSPDVLGGGAPIADCNPVEVKIRLSFRRATDTDYQAVDWDGTRMDMFGMFTTAERRGFERKYGIVDDKWYRFASRHNIWEQSHARDASGELVRCNTQETTPPGADPDRDGSPVTGTADECDAVGGGSRCDKFAHACTLPYKDREVKTRPFYYGPDSDPSLFGTVRDAVSQWDVSLRHAVLTARYTECLRVSQTGTQQSDEEIAACKEQFPTSETRADILEHEPVPVFVFCHNPVIEEDPAECGARGLLARVGDLRYNMTNVIQNPQVPSPWGILADAIDPLTGEVVAASVNIWNAVTDYRTQLTVDQMRWYLGEISNEDVSSGRYLNDYLAASTRAPAPRLVSAPILDNAQVGRRLAAVDRQLQTGPTPKTRPNLKQRDLIDWASQQARSKFGDAILGSGNAGARARLLTARDSAVETKLTSNSFLRLAGLNPSTPPSATTLDLASPLRGNAVAFKAELDRLRENQMGQDGQCMLSGPDPISVDDWAQILAEKFPLPENPSSAEVMERNQKWHDYVRRYLTYGVMLHELGHSMGLRHVFTSSYDALNYHPQYWQLRTQDGSETSYCAEATADGASCVGPRWRDPVTPQERDGLISMWEHTSVMDYPGDLTQEAVGLGAYDRAAIRFGYADVTDVVDDPSVRCPPSANGTSRSCSNNGRTISDLIDSSFGGIGGPWYRDNSAFFHYSQLAQKLGLVRECRPADTSPPADWDEAQNGKYSPVFDGQIVNGTKCDGMPNDYVAYSELQLDAPGFQQAFGAFGGDPRKFDSRGRVRRPYMFGSDEYADIGNLAVLRDDHGADAYEIVNFMINSYEDSHLWESYRRNRSSFSLKQAFMRGYTRYNAKLKEISKGFGLFSELFSATDLLELYTTGDTEADGLLRPSAIATSMVFDHFTRILTRPTSGAHFLDAAFDPRNGATPGGFAVFRSDDQQLQVNAGPNNGGVLFTVPDGSQGIASDLLFGGRPLFNQLDRSKGYYATQYDQWVGSYYDKTLVAEMLTDCEDRFISQSRDDFSDGRYRNISFATIFPEGVRRLLAAALTEDQTALGWRVETKNGRPALGADQTPSLGMGFRSFWPKDGPEVCWRRSGAVLCKEYPSETEVDASGPEESAAIDPEIGFEVQKFLVFSALVNLPESYKTDWIDLMRIFRLGTDAPPLFPPEQQATWVDPLSGQSYVAHRYGTETIDGQAVDRGIGARMLDWMNVLTLEAYETAETDPETGALNYVRGTDGQPVVKSQRFVNRVKSYQGLLDFMQEVSGLFGFNAPNWRGVY
ncbi:MAG: hypothetical protein K0R38_1911 [Polyangiaceae bacterium]|nr:hypothetical protein [Polyangiaceae bacterium]